MTARTRSRLALALAGVLALASTVVLASSAVTEDAAPREWPNSLDEARRVLAAPFDRLRSAIGAVHGRQKPQSGLFISGRKFGNRLTVELSHDLPPGLRLFGRVRPEASQASSKDFTVENPRDHVDLRVEEALDVSLTLVDPKGEVLDQLYLSDGHFTGFDDSAFGGQSRSVMKINQDCARRGDSGIMATPLSGCAHFEGSVERYGVIARTLEGLGGPVDLERHHSISFLYRSTQSVMMCLESRRRVGKSQPCTQLPPQLTPRRVHIPRDAFSLLGGDTENPRLDDIEGISWNVWNPTPAAGPMPVEVRIEAVTLYEERPTRPVAASGQDGWVRGGCTQSARPSWWMLGLVVALLVWRRKRPV